MAVEHHAPLRSPFSGNAEQSAHLRGYRLPQRVAEDQVGRAVGPRIVGDRDHPVHRNLAVERAREGRRDAQLDRAADIAADLFGVGKCSQARVGASTDVGLVVLVGCRQAVLEVAGSGRRGLLDVAGVATHTQQRRSSSGVSSAITSSVLAIGGTRSPRAIDPISSSGTPNARS